MTRVGLDDDGAAGSECRGRVSPERGESEGEVGRGEDRDGPERHIHAAQIGPRRSRIGQGLVEDDAEEGAIAHHLGHETQLTGRATDLTGKAVDPETALLDGDGHECITRGIDRIRDRLEQARSRRQVRVGVPLLG